jgi:hypothetical protein
MSLDHLQPYLELEGFCQSPIFIIGSPRSGTTALAHALGRHPELWVSKESYLIYQLYGNERVGQVWQHNWKRATPSWLREQGVERAELLGFLGLAVNALFSSRSGGRRWVDQTPLYTEMVDDLADMFPGAVFLHIVRDGRSVVRSMNAFGNVFDELPTAPLADEMPPWTDDFQLACETWAEHVEAAYRFGELHPERCLTIRNEHLAAEPHDGFAAIHAFLGVQPNEAPAAFFGRRRINSSFRISAEQPHEGGWEDWPVELREVFVDVAGPTLVREGYASTDELDRWAERETA